MAAPSGRCRQSLAYAARNPTPLWQRPACTYSPLFSEGCYLPGNAAIVVRITFRKTQRQSISDHSRRLQAQKGKLACNLPCGNSRPGRSTSLISPAAEGIEKQFLVIDSVLTINRCSRIAEIVRPERMQIVALQMSQLIDSRIAARGIPAPI